MANSYRTKRILTKKDDVPSPCLTCPKRQHCLDRDLICEALRKWQAEYRNLERPRILIYTAA